MLEENEGEVWEEERKQFFEDRGMTVEEVEGKREEEGEWFMELERRDGERQTEERREKLREAKFSRFYGGVKGAGIPGYLKKGWGESRWRRVARFRLGNEIREGRY